MRALVTGGTGFVGAYLVRALLDAGHTPRVLHRASSSMAALAGLEGYETALGDVLDVESLAGAVAGCDWVFHVAAVSDYWRQPVERLYAVNVGGTRNVLAAARRAGVRRVIYTSSAAAVGLRSDHRPADETLVFNLLPREFPYGHSKYLAELEVYKAVIGGLDCVILNPAVVIGPGDLNRGAGSLLLEMAQGRLPPIPPGGVTVIDVRDVAAAHLAAAERGRVPERYLLGAVNLSYRAWFALAAKAVGIPRPRIPLPVWTVPVAAGGIDLVRKLGFTLPVDGTQVRLSARQLHYDCSKACQELGEPVIDVQQSLAEAWAWYQKTGMI